MAGRGRGFEGRILEAGKDKRITNKEKNHTCSSKPSAHSLAISSAKRVRTALPYGAFITQEQWWGLGKKE